jgi:hypothetical protein
MRADHIPSVRPCFAAKVSSSPAGQMERLNYPIWRPRELFFCRLLPPLRIQAQNQSSREGSPIGLGLSGGYPTNEPRGRASPTKLRITFNGTPPNLIGVLGGLGQKKKSPWPPNGIEMRIFGPQLQSSRINQASCKFCYYKMSHTL